MASHEKRNLVSGYVMKMDEGSIEPKIFEAMDILASITSTRVGSLAVCRIGSVFRLKKEKKFLI